MRGNLKNKKMRLSTKIFLLTNIMAAVVILSGCQNKTESIPDPSVANVFLKMQVKSEIAAMNKSGRVMDSTLLLNELIMGVREIRFVEMGADVGNTGNDNGTDTGTDSGTDTGNTGTDTGTDTGTNSGTDTGSNTGNTGTGDSGTNTSTGGSSGNTGSDGSDSSQNEDNDKDKEDKDDDEKDDDKDDEDRDKDDDDDDKDKDRDKDDDKDDDTKDKDDDNDDEDDDRDKDDDDDDDRIADSMGGTSLNSEIVFSGGFVVDLIRGTSTPDFGTMEVIPGTYQRIVIESGPYLENGNTLFIAMEYYENGSGPQEIEFTSQSEITIDVENPEGIQLDGGSFIQILILLNFDKLFAGVNFNNAEPDADGVIRINSRSNSDLAMIIESQLGPAFEAGTDVNGDGVIDSADGI
jgi:hypothetical protein